MTTTIEFTEDFKFKSGTTRFTASSYRKWLKSVVPNLSDVPRNKPRRFDNFIPIGDWRYYQMRLPAYYRLTLYRGDRIAGHVQFDGDVYVPIISDRYGVPWMSLTPNEVLTLRGQIRRSKGKVGIAGLGMGWAVRRVLERSKVDSVTVVEKSASIVDQFGLPLKREFGHRLTIIEADAYEYDRWMDCDSVLWDIWQSYGEGRWDSKFQKLKETHPCCVGWGA